MAENERIVVGPDGTEHHFPAEATDAMISRALGAIPEANAASVPNAPTWKALAMQGAAKVVPVAANMTAMAANAKDLPKTAGAVGNAIGFMAPIVKGAYDMLTGSPSSLAHAAIEAGPSAWAAGKGAYFTAAGAQRLAKPLATAAQTVAPYAQTLSTLSGAQGVGDLAQMAEPNRTDIGMMGIGASNTDVAQRAAVMKMQIQNLVNEGVPLSEALRRVSDAWRPR